MKSCSGCGKALTPFEIEAGWFDYRPCKEIAEVYCEHEHEYRPGQLLDKLPLCESCHIEKEK